MAGLGYASKLSQAWAIDYAGNDEYHGAGHGLGSAVDNGMAFFFDLSGDDEYSVGPSASYGYAQINDRGERFDDTACIGFFIDGHGVDVYPNNMLSPAENNANWFRKMEFDVKKQGFIHWVWMAMR